MVQNSRRYSELPNKQGVQNKRVSRENFLIYNMKNWREKIQKKAKQAWLFIRQFRVWSYFTCSS